MRCCVGSGSGFPPSVWEGNRDITGQDQESPRACSAYLHPMQQNFLSTKAVLTLSSPFVITLTKLILTSSSHIWKTPELDVVLTQLPESMLWLQNQMRAVLKKFYSQLIELKSVGRRYPHPMHPFIYFVTLIVKEHASCRCCRGSKTLVSVRLRNCGSRMLFYSTYMKQATPLYGRLMCQAFPDPQQAPWQHTDNLTDAQGWCYFLVNSATSWLYRNDMGHKLLVRGEILQFHIGFPALPLKGTKLLAFEMQTKLGC